MPVIRFVREGRDVECYPGENLREVALREGIELYGLKGQPWKLWRLRPVHHLLCGDLGEAGPDSLSPRTGVEDAKLKRRPEDWRLACQALVQRVGDCVDQAANGSP